MTHNGIGVTDMIRRQYMPHRRAYAPRLWPSTLVSVATVIGVTTFMRPGLLAAVIMGVVLGCTIGYVRWAIWRRHHPIVPPRITVYVIPDPEHRRERAPWN